MAKERHPPKVVKLAEWRRKRLKLQSQEEYIDKLCSRCHDCPPAACPSQIDVRRLAEIQREVILGLLHGERDPESEKPKK